jgi:hypothetical protein
MICNMTIRRHDAAALDYAIAHVVMIMQIVQWVTVDGHDGTGHIRRPIGGAHECQASLLMTTTTSTPGQGF